MKKMMFNDKYHLTESVLNGTKCQTRRNQNARSYETRFREGEIVAVAQSYSNIGLPGLEDTAGWNNKMFVKAENMPHQIMIEKAYFQRLQDISSEDCLEEGITPAENGTGYTFYGAGEMWNSPKEAYSVLIDRISGKGTWDTNEMVEVYKFKLVK